MPDLVGSPDIILVWPHGRPRPEARPVSGYSLRAMRDDDDRDGDAEADAWWIDIHRRAVPSFKEPALREWLARYRRLALPNGILIAIDEATGEPVATAGSIANSKDGMFPGGGQLAWVATVPTHRGRGLAQWLSALATARLIDDGFTTIFLCTGDDMLAAIRVYLRLGYVPHLYAADQPDRWRAICDAIGRPFTPEEWVR